MRRIPWLLFMLLSIMIGSFGLSNRAHAQSITVSDTDPAVLVPSTGSTLTFPQFDTSVGVLTSVDVTVTGEVTGTLSYENLHAFPQEITVANEVVLALGLPGNVSVSASNFESQSFPNIPAYDGTFDYGGSSGGQVPIAATLSNMSTFTDSAILSQLISTGNVSFTVPITTVSPFTVTGDGPAVALFQTGANVEGQITYNYLVPDIAIEKSTNGFDADTPRGPQILVGDDVIWAYQVTNTGQVDFAANDIQINDSVIGPVTNLDTSTDLNSDGILSVGESWTYTATGAATLGQYMNVGDVEATVPGFNGVLTDNDPSHYFGINPQIDIEKSTNGEDADTGTGPLILEGNPVTWEYVVSNTGNIAIENVSLADGDLPAGSSITLVDNADGDALLAPGEVWVYRATGTAVPGQYENLGQVTGDVPNVSTGPGITETIQVADEDPSHYFGITPAIDIEKSTNGEDADTGTGPLILEGNPVTWEYVVSNTGNITIENVTLVDTDLPVGSSITLVDSADGDALLAPGEVWIYRATGTAVLGQYENLGQVTGDVPNVSTGPGITETIQVADEDPSHYFGYSPAIIIEKATNGEDADTIPGPQIVAGDMVTWNYVVTNTGNITLANLAVTDSVVGVTPVIDPTTDLNNDGLLSPGESWRYSATGTSTPGQYENIGSVTADVSGTADTVTDDDPSHYFGGTASIGVDKTVDQQLVAPGTTVTYSYIVSNTGNVPVSNVVVVDDQCAPVEPVLSGANILGDTNGDSILDLTELWSYSCAVALNVDTINVVTVTGDDPLGNPTEPVTDTETVDVLPTAILTKSANPTLIPEAGEIVTFTVEIENTSQERLTLIDLTDSIFGNLNGQGSCAVPQTLSIGGTYSCTFSQALSGTTGTPHTNVVTATLTDDEGNPVQPSDDALVNFDPPGSIDLSKTPDKTIIFEPGEDVTFTIVISNTSPNDVVTINAINDSIFGDVTIRSNTDCTVPQTIAVGGTYTCTFTEFIFKNNVDGDGDNTVHRNIVTGDGVDEDGNPLTADDDAMVLIDPPRVPNLILEKTDLLIADVNGDGTASPGDTIRYDIIIRNTGGGPATGVVLTDTVSIHTAIKPGSVAPSKGVVVSGNSPGDRAAVINIGTVNAGETVNVSLDVIVDSLATCAISIQNQALITSNESERILSAPIGNNIPVPTITLITGTDLEVRQSISTASVNGQGTPVVRPGETMNYSVEVRNSVALTATNVFLEVKLDGNSNLLLDSVRINGQEATIVTYLPETKEFAVGIGSVAPGATMEITYDAQLVSPLPPAVNSVMNVVDIVYDFNNVGGQTYEPLIDPSRVDKCLVTGTGEVPTSLVVINEPDSPTNRQSVPVIFVPVVQ